ncbi:MAG: hypothetical protein K0R91_385 [Nitrososphaeraceae archaeon]|jgi:hypothetical protein|nr:hypothetical protein [Nitrososphaeraceae archaeon]
MDIDFLPIYYNRNDCVNLLRLYMYIVKTVGKMLNYDGDYRY